MKKFQFTNSMNTTKEQNQMAGAFRRKDLQFLFEVCKKAGAAVIYNNGHNQISAWTPEAAQFIEAYDLYPVLIEDWKGEAVYELKVLTTDRALLEKINRRIPALANPAICAIQAAI